MKPRLKSAPPTDHDESIWWHLAGRKALRFCSLVDSYAAADRRDADLMLWIGTRRQLRTVYVDGEPFETWLLPGFEDAARVRAERWTYSTSHKN